MAIFQDLELDKFYLIKLTGNEDIKLVQVAMSTDKCVLVYEFGEMDLTYWKKKDEQIIEIVEELTDEAIGEYESLLLEDFDEEELRPYFSLSSVMAGMFALTGRLFGIRVTERQDVPAEPQRVRRGAGNAGFLGE